MGNYSVPDSIRKLKPQGTMVKKIKDRYYVYQYKTTKEAVVAKDGSKTWKTKTVMGPCIGSITAENGFIPNTNYLSNSSITGREYGDYAFAIEKSQPTLEALKAHFNVKDALQIYTVGLIFFVNGFCYMKNMKQYYDYSYLAMKYPDVHVGESALHTLYENLGRRGTQVIEFEQAEIDNSSKQIAIDGHVIACTSDCNDLSEYGYKSKKLGTKQINWLTAYDVVLKKPLLSQLSSGAEPDCVSVKVLFDKFRFSNTEFLTDRGFNTKDDKALMSSNGNSYIVPMISTRKDYKEVVEQLKFDRRRYFVYNKQSFASMIYYQEFNSDGNRYFAYQDTTRAAEERQDYLRKMATGKPGYTIEGLEENEIYFGLFLLEVSDKTITAEEAFCHYKSRWQIETYYNYVRNDSDFNALYQQDYYLMQGLSFIVTIAGMIHHDVKTFCEGKDESTRDVMNEMKKLKIGLIGGNWLVQNTVKSVREMSEKLGFAIPTVVSV